MNIIRVKCQVCNGSGTAPYSYCCESEIHNGMCMDCNEKTIKAPCCECNGGGYVVTMIAWPDIKSN